MRKRRITAAGLSIGILLAVVVDAQDTNWTPLSRLKKPEGPAATAEYLRAIDLTARMAHNPQAKELVQRHGLRLLNLTWEDTGRYKNSSVGPNISDMTIQVAVQDPRQHGQQRVQCMPIIRFDNFIDTTADVDPEAFTLLVGNEKAGSRQLKRVSLREFLETPTYFMSNPRSWKSYNRSLLSDRDSKVLVSAQAAFLPVPKQGKATFNPVLFNYQSRSGDPAVLTILATREGTSMTIIDNKRDAFSEGTVWGQRLFFNQAGMRASLTGERLSDFKASSQGISSSRNSFSGLNMVLLIQVPLKQKSTGRGGGFGGGSGAPAMEMATKSQRSDVEAAVIGHGELEGPFTEVDNLAIERDHRFPVRVTVQFYKATSNGVASAADIQQIRREIDEVYSHGENVGSLVVGGETGRITEYIGMKVQPANWWHEFWRRHQENTGDTPDEAQRKLRKLLGSDYETRPVCKLYLNDLLRK